MLVDTFARQQSPGACVSGRKSFRELVDYALQRAQDEPINKLSEFFIWLRVNMIHPLVQHAARQFIDTIEAVYHGTLDRALLEDGRLAHAIVQTFKDVAMDWEFYHRCRMLQDFLSGMTDQHAQDEYRALSAR